MAQINAPASAADRLAAFLRGSLGFSYAGVAGWEGNTEVESRFNPGAQNSAEGAIGWQQWEGARRSLLDQLAARLGVGETDERAQEAMIATELQGYPQLLQELRTTTDAAQAAADVDALYERSSGSTRNERISDAQQIYADLVAGRSIGAGPGAPAGAGFASVGGVANVADLASLKNPFPGGGWDPLNWPTEVVNTGTSAAGSVAGGVLKVVLPFATKAAFVVGGLALVVIGFDRAAAPAKQNIAQQLAPLVALIK